MKPYLGWPFSHMSCRTVSLAAPSAVTVAKLLLDVSVEKARGG
jgi:hypothetical protein